jgi:predicted transcriptional regulator
MSKRSPLDLGKRERQIVEVVYRLGEASVAEVRGQLPDPPSYSAVRAMLGLLVEKRVLKYRRDGKRYLYRPAMPKEKARQSVLRNLLATFFGGRPTDAMAALLEISAGELSDEDLDRMRQMIDQAREEDR